MVFSTTIHIRSCEQNVKNNSKKVLPAKIEASLSPDVSNTSATIVSSNSFENPTQSRAANNEVKLHPSVRGNVKATRFMNSMELSMPKLVPAQLVSGPTICPHIITSIDRFVA
ncbi:hypothetical protein ACTXT7_013138 [Hymenolepis weldensis]